MPKQTHSIATEPPPCDAASAMSRLDASAKRAASRQCRTPSMPARPCGTACGGVRRRASPDFPNADHRPMRAKRKRVQIKTTTCSLLRRHTPRDELEAHDASTIATAEEACSKPKPDGQRDGTTLMPTASRSHCATCTHVIGALLQAADRFTRT